MLSHYLFPSSNYEVNGFLHHFPRSYLSFVVNSSPSESGRTPETVFDPNDSDYWSSTFDENANISIHFTKHKIALSHYSFMSFPYECEHHSHAKAWKVEGTTIDDKIIKIDDVDNNPVCGYNKIIVRTIYSNEYFKSFTFIITDVNELGNYQLKISKIDFYGVIQELYHSHSFNFTTTLNLNIFSKLFCLISLTNR